MSYYNNNILQGATEQDPLMPRGKTGEREGRRHRVGKAIRAGGKPKGRKSNKRELRGAEERKVNSLHLTFPLSQEEGREERKKRERDKKGNGGGGRKRRLRL